MTTAPFTPSDFKNLIISFTAKFCLAFVKLFNRFPILVYNLVNFMWNADGTINENQFLRQIFNPGDIKLSASTVTPIGFLLCDGASYLRTDKPELFAAIGSVYGTADADHFNVPDYRGRFPIGVGTTNGLKDSGGNDIAGTTYALAAKGGEEKHVLTVAELAKHKHQMCKSGTENTSRLLDADNAVFERGDFSSPPSYNLTREDDAGVSKPTVGPTSEVGTASDATDLSLGGHNNIPPYVAMYYYIKT